MSNEFKKKSIYSNGIIYFEERHFYHFPFPEVFSLIYICNDLFTFQFFCMP
jgi:hypothetical protein